MRNTLILGTARSGTSMTASLFRHSGAYMGFHPLKPTSGNPRGFFEDEGVNQLNNQIITRMVEWPCLNYKVRRWISPPAHFDYRAFFAAAPIWLRPLRLPSPITDSISWYASKRPFCYKDPRFNVTLRYWLPFLGDRVLLLVVFREPGLTVASILRIAKQLYRPPLQLTAEWALKYWYRSYHRIVNVYANRGECFFVHFDQICDKSVIPTMEELVEANLDASQVDSGLMQSKADDQRKYLGQQRILRLYQELCRRASYPLATG